MPRIPKTFTDKNGNKGMVGYKIVHWLVDKYGEEIPDHDEELTVEGIEIRGRLGCILTIRNHTREVYKGEHCYSDTAKAYVVVKKL